jgi:hypothetical protein
MRKYKISKQGLEIKKWTSQKKGQIYVLTFKENKADDDECMIPDLKGTLLKRIFLPLKMSTPLLPYSYMIHEESLYQVVEDEEEEEWSIHITEIK